MVVANEGVEKIRLVFSCGGVHHLEEKLLASGPVWRTLAVGKDVLVDVVAHSGQVRHIEMPVDLLEATVLMPEVATLAIGTELLSIELSTILRLVFVIHIGLFLLVEIQLVILAELFLAMGVLALGSIAAKARLSPILAHITLVHGPLDKALLDRGGEQLILS